MNRVDAFEIDDFNESEMARHHVTPREALQALSDEDRVIRRNGGDGAAQQPYVLIGRTHGGRWLHIPIRPIDPENGIWRPATARTAEPDEIPKHGR